MNINKKNLSVVAACAGKDDNRDVLKGIHITKHHTEATDGHILARVTLPGQVDPQNIPDAKTGDADAIRPFTIPQDIAKVKIPNGKSQPRFQYLYVDVNATNDNGNAIFNVVDLDTTQNVVLKKIDAMYPDTEKVVPTKEPAFQISVDPELMERICRIAKQFTNTCNGDDFKTMKISFYAQNESMKVEATDVYERQKFTGIIMPQRSVD